LQPLNVQTKELKEALLSNEAGKTVYFGGIRTVYKVRGEETGGRFAIVAQMIEPRTLVAPPHIHRNEDELSYVVEGEINALVGDRVIRATAGSFIVKPLGIIHTYWNSSDKPAKTLEVVSPAGFEKFFEGLASLFAADGTLDINGAIQLAKTYGLENDISRVPELEKKYGVVFRTSPNSSVAG
jgi:quercetin dioxygenase-like cupin family protein